MEVRLGFVLNYRGRCRDLWRVDRTFMGVRFLGLGTRA